MGACIRGVVIFEVCHKISYFGSTLKYGIKTQVFNGVKKGKGFMNNAAHLLQKVNGAQGCGLRKITRTGRDENEKMRLPFGQAVT